MKSLSIIVLSLAAFTATAYGDYTLTPEAGGDAWAIVGRGGTFTLDLVLTSDASDAHYASLFTVEFSIPGLIYNGHTWGSPYLTGGEDDWSEPANGDLPVALDADTFVNTPGFDPGTVDVWLENMVPVGPDIGPLDVPFTTGTLVSLSLTVPTDFPTAIMIITAIPDTFDDGWGSINATGATFAFVAEMQGDVDRSGYVDDDDLSLLLASWGQDTDWAHGNLNADTTVDDDDLSLLLANWNQGTSPPPAAPVPEPAMMMLLVAGATVLLRRRKA